MLHCSRVWILANCNVALSLLVEPNQLCRLPVTPLVLVEGTITIHALIFTDWAPASQTFTFSLIVIQGHKLTHFGRTVKFSSNSQMSRRIVFFKKCTQLTSFYNSESLHPHMLELIVNLTVLNSKSDYRWKARPQIVMWISNGHAHNWTQLV